MCQFYEDAAGYSILKVNYPHFIRHPISGISFCMERQPDFCIYPFKGWLGRVKYQSVFSDVFETTSLAAIPFFIFLASLLLISTIAMLSEVRRTLPQAIFSPENE